MQKYLLLFKEVSWFVLQRDFLVFTAPTPTNGPLIMELLLDVPLSADFGLILGKSNFSMFKNGLSKMI